MKVRLVSLAINSAIVFALVLAASGVEGAELSVRLPESVVASAAATMEFLVAKGDRELQLGLIDAARNTYEHAYAIALLSDAIPGASEVRSSVISIFGDPLVAPPSDAVAVHRYCRPFSLVGRQGR
jgi:hypothetical protein